MKKLIFVLLWLSIIGRPMAQSVAHHRNISNFSGFKANELTNHHDPIPGGIKRESKYVKLNPLYGKLLKRNGAQEILDSVILKAPLEMSGIWEPLVVVKYGYNSEQLLSSLDYYTLNPTLGTRRPVFREEFFYDAHLNVESYSDLNWDTTSMAWAISSQELFAYDKQDNLVEESYFYWEPENQTWRPSSKTIYSYSDDHLVVEEINSYWDFHLSQLTERYKTNYFYNSLNELTAEIDYSNNSETGEWDINWKIEYKYNFNHKETLRTFYDWLTNAYELDYKVASIYDGHGNLTFSTGSRWENAWMNEYEYRFEYDVSDRQIAQTDYYWDPGTLRWIGEYRYGYQYNEFDDITHYVRLSWDIKDDKWVYLSKVELLYDTETDGEDIIWPVSPLYDEEDQFPYHKKVLAQIDLIYNPETTTWEAEDSILIYYSPLIILSTEFHNKADVIYPNPTSDQLWISLGELGPGTHFELFTLDGKKVLGASIQENLPLSLTHIPPGIYGYRIHAVPRLYSGQIIIQ